MDGLDFVGQLEHSFNRKPVGIVEFAESPQFCNKTLYPRQKLLLKLFFLEELTDAEEAVLDHWIAGGYLGEEIEISPGIRERIQYLKDNGYKHFREIVLVGGRRCSKGFITGVSLSKLVFDLVQLHNPQDYYGIDPGKQIVFPIVAAAQEQAKDMQFSDFTSTINTCAALQRNIYKSQELELSLMTETDIRTVEEWKRRGRRVQKDTSSIRGRAMAANARTLRGMAAMAVVFDEYAHFMQGENDQSDSEIYGAATPALAQFGRDAMIFCNSSPYSKVGKFYERYEEGMATDNGKAVAPTTLSLRFPSWALFEGWWSDPDYAGPKKCITVSPDWDINRPNEDDDGTILDGYFYTEDDRQAILIARQEEASDAIKFKVERRGHFAEVIDAYLDPEKVERMFKGRPEWAPMSDPEINPDHPMLYYPYNVNWNDATNQYKYVGHIDPSSTTAGFGFALGHIEFFQINEEINSHVVFDIVKRWDPKDFTGGAIEWEPILEELLTYITFFRPERLTFDQHQNRWPMEWLQKEIRNRGLGETRIFERTADLQRNWSKAEVFRTALYHDRVHAPSDTADCDYASNELKYLQEVKTARIPRIEKQDVGPIQTKDVADCIMEVVEVLIGSEFDRREALAMPITMGSPGGYRMGGNSMEQAVPDEIAGWYSKRHGEQGLGRARTSEAKRNPARRPFGGRPIPRRLPNRRLPGR
jgi:hypothetical protein